VWKTEHSGCLKEGKERERVMEIETVLESRKGQI
jgi:hypothetical protein